jgi:esterase/lipase superfamily enzyme
MTKTEIYSLLMRCNGAQLTAVTQLVGLNPAFLPDPGQAIAARASDILILTEQSGRLAELEKVLLEFFPNPPSREQLARESAKSSTNQEAKPKRILVLAANPIETDRLQIEQELFLIKKSLNEAEVGRGYRLEAEWAVRATDLSKFLLQYEPAIVHFSGHGSPTGEIVLEDDSGKAAPLQINRLAHLFEILKSSTECVVLNACFSLEKANLLRNYVGCVVGMEKAIGDPAALRFSEGFYRGVAFGKDYYQAFQLGCSQIDMAALPDASIPHFTTREEDRVGRPAAEPGVPPKLAVPTRTWIDEKTRAVDPDQPNSPRLYPVWFGTNRQPNDLADLTKGFSNNRASDESATYYGICKVAIPKSHKFGSVGSSWWKRFRTWTDDRLQLQEIEPLGEEKFWESTRRALAEIERSERIALVFIHGFRVTFEDAAIRAAQIGFDLKIPGMTAFFSWPSKGRLSLSDYKADEATIQASVASITNFLVQFAARTDAERIHILAHSMGNRGLLQAMQRIVVDAAKLAKKPFGHIVFAAPDEDSTVFCDLAKIHDSIADHATLYVSSHDRAVASSGLIHQFARAGFVPPVTLVKGIDTIEVSNVDLTMLGHGYYGAAEPVLYDMRELLIHNELPKSRARLTAVPEGYWQINQ